MDEVELNMVEVASQTRGETEVDVGDSFTFMVQIDFPAIPEEDMSDLTIETFAINSETGNEKGYLEAYLTYVETKVIRRFLVNWA